MIYLFPKIPQSQIEKAVFGRTEAVTKITWTWASAWPFFLVNVGPESEASRSLASEKRHSLYIQEKQKSVISRLAIRGPRPSCPNLSRAVNLHLSKSEITQGSQREIREYSEHSVSEQSDSNQRAIRAFKSESYSRSLKYCVLLNLQSLIMFLHIMIKSLWRPFSASFK